jgi:hypothetical protein
MAGHGLEPDRLDEHRDIAHQNGERIIANPNIALDAITRQQATFTRRDLAKFAHRHSDGLAHFNAVMSAVEGSPDLVRLGRDGRGEERLTSRAMIAVEERLPPRGRYHRRPGPARRPCIGCGKGIGAC